jgi:hypothetical protein
VTPPPEPDPNEPVERSEPGLETDPQRSAGAPGDGDLDVLARTAGEAARRVSGAVAGATFVVLHAVVGWLVLSLGLLAPIWALVALLALWALVAVIGWRVRRRYPIVTMLLPLATASLVLVLASYGSALLGWDP